jgi:hypothetical protein
VPDPEALQVDALSMKWAKTDVYAFPPIAMVPKVLEKLSQ